MAKKLATTADILAPINYVGAAIRSVYTYTGGANATQSTTTSAGFTVIAVASSVVVPVTTISKVKVGGTYKVSETSHVQTLQVTSISGSNATGTALVATVAGQTMASAAVVANVTAATFLLVAVGSSFSVPMGSTAQALQFNVGDSIGVTDATSTIVATVTAQSGANLVCTMVTLTAGSAGDTMAIYATVTSSSGDKILFVTIPPFCRVDTMEAIIDTSVGSLTISGGIVGTDGTEYSHLADLIKASTTFATLGRVATNSAVAPFTTDKNSYLAVTITGADVAAAVVITVMVGYQYLGTP